MKMNIRYFQGKFKDILSRLIASARDSCEPLVLMYHEVNNQATKNWGPWKYAITPEEFDTQIKWLTEHRNIVPIDDLIAWLVGGKKLPDKPAVITFDDGYQDYRTEALPILKRHNIPSTIYISTALSQTGPTSPFEHRLASAIESVDQVSVSLENISFQSKTEDFEDTIAAYNELRQAVKRSDPTIQDQLIEEVGGHVGTPAPVLGEEELVTVSSEPLVTIGSHGSEHVPFTSLSTKEQEQNIQSSRDWLTEVVGTSPKHFSFPYGSFDKRSIEIVQNAGFESAVTTESRAVSPRDWNKPYTIPRIDASGDVLNAIQ